ncbi:RNA-directed DNA polymerase, eukaryota [Tanacetum coccineum]
MMYKISTSIFVTNFPELFTAKDLFHSCKVYGHVVDSFIPLKRSREGKRFGFVRFINVFNVERAPANGNPKSGKPEHVKKDGGNNRNGVFTPRKGVGSMENDLSSPYLPERKKWPPYLISKKRLLMKDCRQVGRTLDFDDQEDLYFHSKRLCIYTKLRSNIFKNFKIVYRGKVCWIRAKEVPGWVLEFLDDSDDESQSEEGINDHERLGHDEHSCGEDNDVNEVGGMFDESSGQKKNHSEDPFGLYSLLNKNKDDTYVNGTEDDQSIKYPPGVTPVAENREFNLSEENVRSTNVENLQQGDDVEILDEQKDIHDVKGSNTQDSVSACLGKFKRSAAPEIGGSILCLLEELVKGNLCFDHVHSDSVGNSGGILCMCDPNSFRKNNVTVFDYFVIIRGVWLKTNVNLFIVVVYAPHDSRDKRMLWDYLTHVSSQWDGEVVMMGDFNEVRFKSDRFGSVFNVRGADVFNSFIANASLVEVPLGGSAFTWSHKSATKMSKIDRFLISDGLMNTCPNINAITLERYLSDHRPILFRESTYDYGPIPFRFYHHWLALDGFDNFVIDIWRNTPGDKSNAMRNLMYKLKFLKVRIRGWLSTNRNNTKAEITRLIGELAKLDEVIDNGNATDDTVPRRLEVLNSIQNLNQIQTIEATQKAKIKWSVERDENVQFFHGMINKKRSQQNIRGDDLDCMVSMEEVKREVWDCGMDKSPGPDGFSFGFYRHFWPTIDNEVFEAVKYFFIHNNFPIGCNSAFIALIPKIPDANMVKDFRPISLIGSIYKIVAKILANRIVGVLDDIVNEVQSAFIAERQILDGPFILNEVMHWCKTKKKQALFFKVDFEKAYDTVRWDFLDDVLYKFGFGTKVADSMSRVHAWDEVVEKVTSCLSRWKMKTLSIGGRLTLLKSVLGSMPIFHMSIFKVPSTILQRLESIRSRFFKGHDLGSNKASWVKWSIILTSKEKGGLGVSSLYALNRGLLFKWVWKFYAQKTSLWARVIKVIHGVEGKVGKAINSGASSCWTSILREVEVLKQQGVNFLEYLQLNMGNGESTTFWEDRWLEGLDSSFHQKARGGIEQVQYEELSDMVNSISLTPKNDMYVWSLSNSGDFFVASFRKVIDENRYPGGWSRTRWVKYVPIKVNMTAWKIKMDALPTRLNISRRGMDIQSLSCPICDCGVESSRMVNLVDLAAAYG